MRLPGFFSTSIASLFFAVSAFAEEAPPTRLTQAFGVLSHYIVDPNKNCIVGDKVFVETENTDLLSKIQEEATHLTDMGGFLARYNTEAEHPTCMMDDPLNMGTSRNFIYETDKGFYITTANSISSNLDSYPPGLTQDEIFSYRVFGFLEESAHALVTLGLRMNVNYEMQLSAALFSPQEMVKGIWANEAMASTAALIALRQQAEAGYEKHWNALEKFPSYQNIIKAIDDLANEDPQSLYDGRAFSAGFQAWYETPHLKYNYARRVVDGYGKMVDNNVANDLPVDVHSFDAINIVHMAAGLNMHTVFQNAPGLAHFATSDQHLMFLHPTLFAKIENLEAKVSGYRDSHSDVAFKLERRN